MDLRAAGKALLVTGIAIAFAGLCLMLAGRVLGSRRMPGDFVYEGARLKVYAPLGTSILLSLALSGLMWVWNRFR